MRPFTAADILLPGPQADLSAWAVLACDQFTSTPAYWQQVQAARKGKPSALDIILPECYLEKPDTPARIRAIHANMKEMAQKVLGRCVHGFVYVERTTQSGVRRGLVGAVDLEAYSYRAGAAPLVRPSEATVAARIPPRLAVRRGAVLESPHIMMLMDDAPLDLLGGLAARKAKLVQLYDTPLMLGGGRVAGWAVTAGEDIEALEQAIEGLAQPEAFREKYPGAGTAPFALAVGDGNHSLAAAKAYWEELKPALSGREQQVHPARFCLAEVCSVSGPAMHIEPIHRAVFGIEPGRFLCAFEAFLREKGALAPQGGARQLRILGKGGETAGVLCVNSAVHPLAVGTLEAFLGALCAQSGVRVDYIHGEAAVRALAARGEAVGVLLPPFEKRDLLRGVAEGGVLPKKTFSMGSAEEKRYYMECRRILP